MKRSQPSLVLPVVLLFCAPCAPAFGRVLSDPTPPPGATTSFRSLANGTPRAITDGQSSSSRIRVADLGGYLWDVDVVIQLTHDRPEDLDLRLTSPRGTTVVLSTKNVLSLDSPFEVRFDDQALHPVTEDFLSPTITSLAPEGALYRFLGEDPDGWWTLECADGAAGEEGSFRWRLEVAAIDRVPATSTDTQSLNTGSDPIPGGGELERTLTWTGLATGEPIWYVRVAVEIRHDRPSDLELRLIAPSGRVLVLSTNNGSELSGFYEAAEFRDDAPTPVTDLAPGSAIGAIGAIPEGALAGLIGEDPNGTWTLSIRDPSPAVTGTLYRWALDFDLCRGFPSAEVVCDGSSSASCPCGNAGVPGNGCANAFHGGGASLRAEIEDGVAHLSGNDVELVANDLQPFSWCLFLQGNSVPGSGAGDPFGDGLLCVANDVIRLGVKPTFLGGADYPGLFDVPLARRADPSRSSHVYQAIYRTPTSFGPCGSAGGGVNATNAIRIRWAP